MYMAPELVGGNKYKENYNPYKSDIFSLGLTLLQLCSIDDFDRDYDSEKRKKAFYFLTSKTRRFIRSFYGDDIEELIWKCLEFNVETRPDYL